ncbi:hypothetical protein CFK41_09265 [Brachybacterium ginsengisoli]|uniref:Uncharacterized protein n=1 Tax=Brachybacterium ginsengisoli TaxID=1331682 RepID=A0A291GXL6_9MICO|nr:hypothetical protein [Brachybacterium ginsengisoli]ATG54933.1 hypothetical protein CFK41_09265 [Brachybacterium ginsengisoli]
MARTPQSRMIPLVGSAAVSMAVGMIPLHRLPQPVRAAYVVLPAAVAGGVVLAALHRISSGTTQTEARTEPQAEAGPDASRRAVRRRIATAALPLVVGGLTAGAGAGSIVVDRAVENALRRRDIPAPRLMMGLVSGALSLGVDLLTQHSEDDAPAEEGVEPTSPPIAP